MHSKIQSYIQHDNSQKLTEGIQSLYPPLFLLSHELLRQLHARNDRAELSQYYANFK